MKFTKHNQVTDKRSTCKLCAKTEKRGYVLYMNMHGTLQGWRGAEGRLLPLPTVM
jgi:hypothetical protein